MKRAFIGIVIFAFVTVISFLLLRRMFGLPEGISVIGAIGLGALAEILYQRSRKRAGRKISE